MSHSAIVSALPVFNQISKERYVNILDEDNDNDNNNDNVMLPAGDIKVGDYVSDVGNGDNHQFTIR